MKKRADKHVYLMIIVLLIAAFLRIYRLDTIPNGLLSDEAMRGYDAYSILRTGADSFGVRFPLFLRSFDDYTPALYSYLSIPFVAIFGLSPFSNRLAAAFCGVLVVALAYPLIRRPFGRTAALVGAFLLAISPWHILPSRTGTEWILLSLGPILVIGLAYRGLRRPYALIAAGLAAGLALYGYAPIKAFLPILMAGFVAFYWRELLHHRQPAAIALALFAVLAAPIYLFSLTPRGMQRFTIVYEGQDSALTDAIPQLLANYFSYFSPRFLVLSEYDGPKPPLETAQLQSTGLLTWIELGLILLGILVVFLLRKKSAWFLLFWLVAAPIGVNLHKHSPWPTLWLTAIPVPQALAAAGFACLISMAKRSRPGTSPPTRPFRTALLRPISLSLVVILAIATLGYLAVNVHDLFYEFPVYGAEAWGHATRQSILTTNSLSSQYDDVALASEGLPSSIYLLFHTRYDPAKRHADLAQQPDKIWQNIGDYNIGNVRNFVQQPGCHLILTSATDAENLKTAAPQLVTLEHFRLPDGRPVAGLYALPAPSSKQIALGVLFGDEVVLQGFAPVSPADSTVALRPGQAICLVVQWQAPNDIQTDYTVFVHLTGPPIPLPVRLYGRSTIAPPLTASGQHRAGGPETSFWMRTS